VGGLMLGRGDGGETDGCFGGGDLVGLVKLGCEVAYPLPTIAIGENGFLGFIQQMRKPYGLLFRGSGKANSLHWATLATKRLSD